MAALTQDEFIERAKLKHGDNYDYSETIYINRRTKVKVRCKKHNLIILQNAKCHISGHGCPKCAFDISRNWSESEIQFIKKNYKLNGCKFCAESLNRTYNSVQHLAFKLKITKRIVKDRSYNEIPGFYISNLFKRAVKLGLGVDIEPKDVWDLYIKQNKKCALTGWDVVFTKSGEITASVDRKDSSKGYLKDNIQIVHKIVNYCKMDNSEQNFYEICKAVYRYKCSELQRNELVWELDNWNDTAVPIRKEINGLCTKN